MYNVISIIEDFENTVLKHDNKIAVRHRNDSLSFIELKIKSLEIAKRIYSLYPDQVNKPICVFLPKSIDVVISDVGIAYSCNIVNNLDVKTPTNRIESIISVLQPNVIVTNSQYLKILNQVSIKGFTILNIDEIDSITTDCSDEDIYARIHNNVDCDPFCIINTSGSTGTPKGVVLSHRGFRNYVEWACETFKFDGSEILGVMSSIVFDHYMYETSLMMMKGSTLVLLDMMLASFPARLLAEIKDKNVNYIFWVPTVMVNIANMGLLDKIALPDLKMIWFAGEVFPTRQFNIWKQHFPNAIFVNLYGPCEITVDCTYYVVDREYKDDEALPIGISCANKEVFLLDDDDKLCKQGETGEICVKSSYIAMGYYNNPEKTGAVFVQNPLNNAYPEIIYRTGDMGYYDDKNNLIFKGRRDSLIKHMGNRVELSEIEHIILNKLNLVRNSCAVFNFEKQEIVLFYERKEGVSETDLKLAFTKEFPRYMIPSVYIEVEELPRNTNGKIDRLQLKNRVN